MPARGGAGAYVHVGPLRERGVQRRRWEGVVLSTRAVEATLSGGCPPVVSGVCRSVESALSALRVRLA